MEHRSILSVALVAFGILFLFACRKETGGDPYNPVNSCATIVCENGGVCTNGNCNCPAGFRGTHCEIVADPCEDLSCQNGGTCQNGACDCPYPYWGTYCTNVYTPSDVRVAEIRVLKYSFLNAY